MPLAAGLSEHLVRHVLAPVTAMLHGLAAPVMKAVAGTAAVYPAHTVIVKAAPTSFLACAAACYAHSGSVGPTRLVQSARPGCNPTVAPEAHSDPLGTRVRVRGAV